MNVDIGNEAAQFHFWEYMFRISVTVYSGNVHCSYLRQMQDVDLTTAQHLLSHLSSPFFENSFMTLVAGGDLRKFLI
jgi:hypothetical protein